MPLSSRTEIFLRHHTLSPSPHAPPTASQFLLVPISCSQKPALRRVVSHQLHHQSDHLSSVTLYSLLSFHSTSSYDIQVVPATLVFFTATATTTLLVTVATIRSSSSHFSLLPSSLPPLHHDHRSYRLTALGRSFTSLTLLKSSEFKSQDIQSRRRRADRKSSRLGVQSFCTPSSPLKRRSGTGSAVQH